MIRSTTATIARHPAYAKLIKAVREKIDKDRIPDVNSHGIDGGFSGFIYYSETFAFYQKHRAQIVTLVEEEAGDFGEKPANFVAGFACLRGEDLTKEIGEAIYGHPRESTLVTNALAWYAAETVCRWSDTEY